uniref:Pathogenesis-related protein 5-like n=1 Tax=Panagrellus redivivus TaxID=6233 RepID=A0A7E4US84_PANRE
MFKTLVLSSFLVFVAGREIKLINNCGHTIWPGWQGQSATPNGGGTTLGAGKTHVLNVPDNWTGGRIWARTGCNSKFECETGGCGNSEHCNGAWGANGVTLAEFGLKKWDNMDFYDVSLVDGFNVQLQIKAVGGSGSCKECGHCKENLLKTCPGDLKENKNGHVVECQSACTKFKKPEYCCTGSHSTAATCGPTNYSKWFKERCPTAYSYAYDDKTSTFSCTNAHYEVHFC